MELGRVSQTLKRRQFLSTIMPACAICCLGQNIPLALAQTETDPHPPEDIHKFQDYSDMSFEGVFRFAYKQYIGTLKHLGEEIGRKEFMGMLRAVRTKMGGEYGRFKAENLPDNEFSTWVADMEKPSRFWDHVIAQRIVEKTETAYEIEITECLWAKTFRDNDAAEIGYISICHPDFATVSSFNPKIQLVRTKTLMEGHECCNHRWVVEA